MHKDSIDLCILRTARGEVINKQVTRTADGNVVTLRNYPGVRAWTRQITTLEPDIDAVARVISALSGDPRCCLVLGAPINLDRWPLDRPAPRWKLDRPEGPATLADAGARLLPLDLDDIETGTPLDPLDPLPAIAAAVGLLGEPFASSSFVWQLTSKATPLSTRIRARVFFILDRVVPLSELKAWASGVNRGLGIKLLDPAIFEPAQPIYTAAPTWRGGQHDPFPARIGAAYGEAEIIDWDRVPQSPPPQGAPFGAGDNARGPIPHSVADRLARIGDGPGREGLDAPIFDAIAAMARDRWTDERIVATITAAVSAAPLDPAKHPPEYVRRKLDPHNLRRQIRNAERFRASTQAPPRATQTAVIQDAVPLAEAEARMAEVIGAWVRGDGPAKLVLAATLGAGKTTATVRRILAELPEGERCVWAFPTHGQGAEVLRQFNHGSLVRCAVQIEGRARGEEPLCARPHIVKAIAEAGLARHTMQIACKSAAGECAHYRSCNYFAQFRGTESVRLVPHALLPLHDARAFDFGADRLVIDESPLNTLTGSKHYSLGKLLETGGLLADHLSVWRGGGDPDPALREALAEEMQDRCVGELPAAGPGEADEWALVNELERAAAGKRPSLLPLYRAALARLAGETNALWFGQDKDGPTVHVAWKAAPPPQFTRVLVLDATADETVYQALLGPDVAVVRIDVQQNLDVIRVIDGPAGKGRLTDPGGGLLAQACALARGMGAPLITHRTAIEQARGMGWLPSNYPAGWFGNLRGRNDLEEHDALVIAGRPEPPALAVEAIARALWPREALNLTGAYAWHADGPTAVAAHPDSRCDGILRAIREAELSQAIGRLRAVRSPRRKQVIVIGHTPLTARATCKTAAEALPPEKLARLLLAGGGVAPLAPAIMARLLPDVWANPKAAEDWLRRDLKPALCLYSLSIKEMRVLNFRVEGQRRPSTALTWLSAPATVAALEALTGKRVWTDTAPARAWTRPAFRVVRNWTRPAFRVVRNWTRPAFRVVRNWTRPAFRVRVWTKPTLTAVIVIPQKTPPPGWPPPPRSALARLEVRA